MLAGETVDAIAPDLRRHAELGFELLESGIGDYCLRRQDTSRTVTTGEPS